MYIVHRNHLSWIHFANQWNNEDETVERIARSEEIYHKIQPYLTYDVYQNMPDILLDDYLERYYGQNLSKLTKIKTIVDPNNFFNYPQSVKPLTV